MEHLQKKQSIVTKIIKQRQIYLMLLPNIVIFSLLSLYPVIWVLKYMFYQYDGISQPIFIGLDNFARVFFRDVYFWKTVTNTFVYVAGKLLLTLPLAFLLALVLSKKFKGRNFLQAVIFSPTIMSSAVMAMIFYLLFNAYNGDVNYWLQHLGLIKQPINWLGKDWAMVSVVIIGAWGGIGNYMVYFLAGLASIPEEIYESAMLDGVNPFQKMYYITLPMLGPILKVILMLAITLAFQDMQSIMVLTEGGPFGATDVMFLYVYKFFFFFSTAGVSVTPQFGYGAALSVVCALIVGGITIVYLLFSKKLDNTY